LKIGVGITAEHPDFAAWRQECLEAYSLCYADKTTLFDGVNEMIAELDRRGIKWGIITNKPMRFTDKLVPKLGFIIPPAIVVSMGTTGVAIALLMRIKEFYGSVEEREVLRRASK